MKRRSDVHLSRRERQIMDVIYARGQASVTDVLAEVADPPSYSSIRALMRILEEKGYLKHKAEGVKYLYMPTRPRSQAAKTAVRNLLRTFFDGSAEKAVAALLEVADTKMTAQQKASLKRKIDQVAKRGR